MCSEDRLTTLAKWIVARAQRLNIRFVAQLGDAGDRRGSGSLPQMLQKCRRGLAPIEKAGIPLSVCIGNHDYDRPSSERANSAWNQEDAFGMSLYRDAPGFGGTFEQEVDPSGPDAGGTANHLDSELGYFPVQVIDSPACTQQPPPLRASPRPQRLACLAMGGLAGDRCGAHP